MKMRLRTATFLLSATLLASTATFAASPSTIITIVKLSGIPWFDRMEQGRDEICERHRRGGVARRSRQRRCAAPDSADRRHHRQEAGGDRGRTAFAGPFEPILKKAQDRGIKVVTHEASAIQNASYDVEAFRNAAYGVHLMDHLAACMKEEGEYAVFVGSLTSRLTMNGSMRLSHVRRRNIRR